MKLPQIASTLYPESQIPPAVAALRQRVAVMLAQPQSTGKVDKAFYQMPVER